MSYLSPPKTIGTLLVDDEPLARERLRLLLADHADVEIVGECGSGRTAVNRIIEQRPDLLFLDVQMPVMNGFDVLQAVQNEWLPCVIFVTAYDQYALRAFDVCAVDYLLKPFDRARFDQAMGRARNQISRTSEDQFKQQMLALLQEVKAATDAAPRPANYTQRFTIRTDGCLTFLAADEVVWIEAADNYVRLHVGRDAYLLRETLTALEQKLNPRKFVRIHRSAMVNVEQIKELHTMFRGDYLVVLRDGTRLPLGRRYRDQLRAVMETGL